MSGHLESEPLLGASNINSDPGDYGSVLEDNTEDQQPRVVPYQPEKEFKFGQGLQKSSICCGCQPGGLGTCTITQRFAAGFQVATILLSLVLLAAQTYMYNLVGQHCIWAGKFSADGTLYYALENLEVNLPCYIGNYVCLGCAILGFLCIMLDWGAQLKNNIKNLVAQYPLMIICVLGCTTAVIFMYEGYSEWCHELHTGLICDTEDTLCIQHRNSVISHGICREKAMFIDQWVWEDSSTLEIVFGITVGSMILYGSCSILWTIIITLNSIKIYNLYSDKRKRCGPINNENCDANGEISDGQNAARDVGYDAPLEGQRKDGEQNRTSREHVEDTPRGSSLRERNIGAPSDTQENNVQVHSQDDS